MKTSVLTLALAACVFAGSVPVKAQSNYEAYSFASFAGYGPRSADGTGSAARFSQPNGVAVDSAGNVYVADSRNQTIRKITPSGDVNTLAGEASNIGSADGSGSAARFNFPTSVALDGAGNVYVADSANHTIRKITPAGAVSTLAGLAGSPGSANGSGSAARFNQPFGVAVDGAGNVFVADFANHTIRSITPAGAVSTVAGLAGSSGNTEGTGSAARFSNPAGVTVDGAGNLYVADNGNKKIRKITSAGAVSTLAGNGAFGSADGPGATASFQSPFGMLVDAAGNVFVADNSANTIRRITPAGVVSTFAGLAGSSGSTDGSGNAARFASPGALAIGANGDVYVADSGNDTIRRITSAATVTTIAGLPGRVGSSDGTGNAARFNAPAGVAVDDANNVYVADTNNHTIRRIDPSGAVVTIAGLAGSSGASDGAGSAARFTAPKGVAVDGTGNVYVADSNNHTIRKITPSGDVSTLAGVAGSSGSADGNGSEARFNFPNTVAVDGGGNLFVADTTNHTIRHITPSGVVTTFAGLAGNTGSADGATDAARFNFPHGVAVDSGGNVYVADSNNHTIRRITSAGVVETVAGSAGSIGSADGTGSAARFNRPTSVAVDSAGHLYVAETSNHTIRKISPSNEVSTLGGVPGIRGSLDGTGSAALFEEPRGVAVDRAGNVYVADTFNSTIRVGVSPPVIRSPLAVIGTLGQLFVYQFEAAGTDNLSVTGLPDGLAFDSRLRAIIGTPEEAGSFQVSLSATSNQGAATATLFLEIQEAPSSGPVITSSTSATGRTGSPFRFQVITTGGSSATRLDATGIPGGLAFDPVTGLISGTPILDGSSALTLTVTDGNFSDTATLQLTFTSDQAVPVITSPSEATIVPNEPFSYTIAAPTSTPDDPVTYALIGNLPAGLTFDAETGTISGTPTLQSRYEGRGKPLTGGVITNVQIFATNSRGTGTMPLVFFLAPRGVVNIATRLAIGTGENVLIGGFIVSGNAPKKLIIRAIAPSLGLASALQDPTLELREGDTSIASNDDWRAAQEQEILDTTIAPADNRESALLAILQPGAYTAVVAGKGGSTGIGLVEVYDLGTASLESTSNARLANLSTRGFVQTGDDVMIGGFIVSGASTKVIVRAIGPSLGNAGIAESLQDTTLDFVDGNGSLIVANDDWRTGGQEQQIIETTVPPEDNRESAVVATLNAGGYTAVVRGKGGTTGVALVEVYVLQ